MGAPQVAGTPVTGAITSGNTVTLTSWTPQAGEKVLLAICQRDEAIAPSVEGNNLTWTELYDIDNAQGQCGLNLWIGEGASPSSGSITVTVTGNTKPVVCIACRFSGVDEGSPIDSQASYAGPPSVDDDDMQVDITTVNGNTQVVAAGNSRNRTFTVPGDQTAISVNNSAGSGGDMVYGHMWRKEVGSAGAVTMGGDNCLSAAIDYCIAALGLKEAAAAGGGIGVLRRRREGCGW